MFADIIFKNRLIDFDKNHSKCKIQQQNSCNGQKLGVTAITLLYT